MKSGIGGMKPLVDPCALTKSETGRCTAACCPPESAPVRRTPACAPVNPKAIPIKMPTPGSREGHALRVFIVGLLSRGDCEASDDDSTRVIWEEDAERRTHSIGAARAWN